ncbi:MAG: phage tail assembly protein [Candidatus Hydrogenedens sp.]|nr:phage tail assembly protein [Candidatus Hydrogenedentota bacterium]NLF56566.1 phage tail assembly protein [Candidatus Hydrogenedens sp.]
MEQENHAAAAARADSGDRKTFTLDRPYRLATGVMLEQVTVRRAKVRDMKIAQARGNGTAEMELAMISICSDPPITPEDLDEMDFKDYLAIQGFFR